jgi:hypothetical protein
VSGAYAADAIVAQRAKRRLQPFSFSTFGQGVAIGQGGVGFFSYPDDRQRLFILKGRTARHIRNFLRVARDLRAQDRAQSSRLFFLAGTAASVVAPGKRGGTNAANGANQTA